MRTEVKCSLLVLLGWACAGGLLSCKIEAANGPARVSGARVEANTVLTAAAFGMPVFRKAIGDSDVSTFLRTGLRIDVSYRAHLGIFRRHRCCGT